MIIVSYAGWIMAKTNHFYHWHDQRGRRRAPAVSGVSLARQEGTMHLFIPGVRSQALLCQVQPPKGLPWGSQQSELLSWRD